MENITPILQNSVLPNFFGTGIITSLHDSASCYIVEVIIESRSLEVFATVAAGLDDRPAIGDRVLIVSGDDEAVYVTMILNKASKAGANSAVLKLGDKANARIIDKNDAGEVLAIYNKRGELIFEYDPDNDRSRVIIESGNLDIETAEGDISFRAGGQIQLESRCIEMTAKEATGIQRSRFSLGQFKTELQSENVHIKSGINRFELAEVDYSGKKLVSRVSRAKLNWGRVETLVDTVIQKARVSFTTIEELSQIKAGRMRTLVAGAFRLKAQRVKLKADKSVDIDGERINLG